MAHLRGTYYTDSQNEPIEPESRGRGRRRGEVAVMGKVGSTTKTKTRRSSERRNCKPKEHHRKSVGCWRKDVVD